MSVTPIELIDTHAHLDDDRYDVDRQQVISRAFGNGIKTIIVPATTRLRWPKIQMIADRYPEVIPAYGLHPLYLHEHNESDLVELESQIKCSSCIAIGECGLDRFSLKKQVKPHSQSTATEPALVTTDEPPMSATEIYTRQIFFFEAQLNIAAKLDLPVIVHGLQAVEDVILSIKKNPATSGVVHSFNGSLQQAEKLIGLGYRLGFGGAATHPRATKIRKLIQSLPAESILLETDAPDQTGYTNRGQRNEPAYLPEVLQTAAELRGEKPESVALQCNQNAEELFRLNGLDYQSAAD